MKMERLSVGVGESRRSMQRIANIQVSFSNRIRMAKQVVLSQIAALLGDLFPKLFSEFDHLYLLLGRNAQRRATSNHCQFRLVPDLGVEEVAWSRVLRPRSLHHFRFFSGQD